VQRCHCVIAADCGDDAAVPTLPQVLTTASEKPLSLGGSCTLLLGQLDVQTRCLRVFNYGDSGAILFRPEVRKFRAGKLLWPRIVLRSSDQTHFFNCPYQVSSDNFGAAVIERADELSAVVRDGDIVLAATDGVLDNLYDSALQAAVLRALPLLRTSDAAVVQSGVDMLAEEIAAQAHAIGLREDEEGLRTPFMEAAAKEGFRFSGGKLDDVAVVCGLVRTGQRPPTARLGPNFASKGVVQPTRLRERAADGSAASEGVAERGG